MASRRGGSRRGGGSSSASSERSDCCMCWIITAFKVILCLMVLLTVICTIIHLVYLFKPENKEAYLAKRSTTTYWFEVVISFFILFNQLMLLVMLAREQLCGLVVTLVVMSIFFGFRIYGISKNGDSGHATANKTSFGFECLELILLGCYCIILCCAN